MNEKAERINGWAAMIGVVAWVVTPLLDKSFQAYGERYVTHCRFHGRRVYIAALLTDGSIDDDDDMDGGMLIPAQTPI